MAKYDALEAHLRNQPGDTTRLTFEEISRMLPTRLPPSAYDHPPFWSNTDSHVWAAAWQRAGWRTVGYNLKQQYVDFRRFTSEPSGGHHAGAAPVGEAATSVTSLDAPAAGTANGGQDGEDRQLVAIKTRRGQDEFRDRLLSKYRTTCAVSGSTVEPLLEAAHIVPHAVETNYATSNGLLLRADIHTLFDLHLISVDAEWRVVVSRSLEWTEYAQYRGRRLAALPLELDDHPSLDQLKRHRDLFIAREGALDD
ncbi:HNH endonuclease [Paraburkholderia sp. CNPSo 3076]|uniref:HNH endonuclease n=1 Tax=Paraburkholderia sp. CNPSo 3076 TaxID=2940936 RepID=UPI002258BC3E|nr:HNH endonuclease [Paraburkholderia sp. CNPSo 3076]MCX5541472.1 HNH endonuclease [Paraburkholderia sp. CNPSo 3076]